MSQDQYLTPNCPYPLIREDRGLGTAYERLAVYQLVSAWCSTLPIKHALEGPLDGMAGIPGLHLLPLARRGTPITILHPDPLAHKQARQAYAACGLSNQLLKTAGDWPDEPVDLVLSFNALPLIDDWRIYLARLVEQSKRYLLIMVTNPRTYGAWLCRLLRLFQRQPRQHELFDHEATDDRTLCAELRRHGTLRRRGYFDCPWWPDLFVPAGTSLKGSLRDRMACSTYHSSMTMPRQFVFPPRHYPYGTPDGPEELKRVMRWHPSFEQRSHPWPQLFGHHQAYLLERGYR